MNIGPGDRNKVEEPKMDRSGQTSPSHSTDAVAHNGTALRKLLSSSRKRKQSLTQRQDVDPSANELQVTKRPQRMYKIGCEDNPACKENHVQKDYSWETQGFHTDIGPCANLIIAYRLFFLKLVTEPRSILSGCYKNQLCETVNPLKYGKVNNSRSAT